MIVAENLFEPRLESRRRWGSVFVFMCAGAGLLAALVLGVLLVGVIKDGAHWISLKFLTNFPSTLAPEESGVKSALAGTLWLAVLTALFAVPVGVGAAVYLEEYAPRSRFTRFIHLNIANLAGVPSIVYGLLGLMAFVRWMQLGRSVLAGALTLSLLVLPVIITASREALIAVPQTLRLAAHALGATTWQTVRHHVLPAALPGIMTGVILAMSRAIGEAAPLIIVGAALYVPFVPTGPKDDYTALPIQIYHWCDQPQPEFQELAAAGIIILLCILLPINALAIAVRAVRQFKGSA